MASETVADILREMRGCIPQKMEGFENGELVVLDTASLADRFEAAFEREMKHLLANVYGVASWIRGLTSTSVARERGVACEEVGSIAAKLEHLADKAGREEVVSKNATTTQGSLGVGNA